MLNKKFKYNFFLVKYYIYLFCIFFYIIYIYNIEFNTNFNIIYKNNFFIQNKLINNIYILINITIIYIIYINKINTKKNNIYINILIWFSIILFFLIQTNSTIFFFLNYELLLLLATIFLKKFNTNFRGKLITIYFLLWTQLGSLLLLIFILYLYELTYITNIINLNINYFLPKQLFFLKLLLFISFSIKLPIWPFSFWLIKTHVEANTSFSIFLSGILVKTALIGLLKLNLFFINSNNIFLLLLLLFNIIHSCLKIFTQIDFKKIIAYTTVQEMSILSFFILYNNNTDIFLIKFFLILHTYLSIQLFYINEIIFLRFKTRQINLFLGIWLTMPKFSILILFNLLVFIGLPLTIKFFIEFFFLIKFFSINLLIFIIIIIFSQTLINIFFTKKIMSLLFGNGDLFVYDLNYSEFQLFLNVSFLILILLI